MPHKELWEQLLGLDGQKTAKRAKCQYLSDGQQYLITMLNTAYIVSLSDKQIFHSHKGSPANKAGFIEQLCLLAYLIKAQDLVLTNKLVRAEALPSGQFFFRGWHSLPTDKLEKAFGERPEQLYRVAERFDAQRREFGDASIQFYVLPRVPLTMVVWGACDEFPARASIFFDQTAAAHIPLDALLACANLAVDEVIKSFEQSS